jgi:hypothetical protein
VVVKRRTGAPLNRRSFEQALYDHPVVGTKLINLLLIDGIPFLKREALPCGALKLVDLLLVEGIVFLG